MELVRAFATAKCLQILIAKLGDDHFGGHLRACALRRPGPTAMVETLLAFSGAATASGDLFRKTSGYLRR